jgi:glycerophosphoryl diester phosphodiesterase
MTWVIAHRGASWDLPENTLPAFERAIELGADFVELDVHPAVDGSLVVCHEPPQGGEPRLEEVLEVCAGRIGVMCELKRPWRYRRHDIVARAVRALPADAIVVCFEPRALEAVRGLRTLQHVGLGVSIRRAARYAWAVGLWEPRARRRGVELAHRLGLRATVYTVNEEARLLELAGLGVDGLFTDRPDLALRTLPPARPPG